MQRRHASDHAERCRPERAGKEVAAHELDRAARALTTGRLDARGVLVDSHHVPNPAGELPGEHPLPTAHIQHPLAARRDSRQDQPVVMDVVSPPPVLLAMEARGLAALPQAEPAGCGKALLRAEQALDENQPEPPSPWISRFDEGSLASKAARCLRRLGQYEAAARQAQRIIEVRPSSHARSRAFGQLLLANVLVAQGEPEAACIAGQQALDATQSLSSYLVAQQLRELAKLLKPYQASQVVAAYLMAVHHALRERLWLSSWIDSDGSNGRALAEPSQ